MPKINREEYEVLKELDDKWKWIARDKSEEMFLFVEKPNKYGYFPQWRNYTCDWKTFETEVFQFIKWEDEEPYNIAELIEEYERYEIENIHVERKHPMFNCNRFNGFYNANIAIWDRLEESEETEVKTLESIREEIWEEMVRLEDKRIDQWADIKYQILREVLQKLGHLDEPEVLSQEWIDENETTKLANGVFGKVYFEKVVPSHKLQNLLVPKQEELEAKIKALIEEYEKEDGAYSNPENGWISGFIGDLESLLEEEQKFYVYLGDGQYLVSEDELKEPHVKIRHQEDSGLLNYNMTFTEQEIKDYDERYWPFAVKVEELEE